MSLGERHALALASEHHEHAQPLVARELVSGACRNECSLPLGQRDRLALDGELPAQVVAAVSEELPAT